jgi:hypothetical protein
MKLKSQKRRVHVCEWVLSVDIQKRGSANSLILEAKFYVLENIYVLFLGGGSTGA